MYLQHRNRSRTVGQVICFLHDCLNVTDAHAFHVVFENETSGKVYDHERMPFAVFWYDESDGYPKFKFWDKLPKAAYWEEIQAEKRPEFVRQSQNEH